MTRRAAEHDLEQVSAFVRELAAAPLDAPPPPDPSLLWWKAQILRRWDAERQAVAPIEVGEGVQLGIGVAGVVGLLGFLWHTAPFTLNTTVATAVALTVGVVVSAAALAAWRSYTGN